MRSRPFGQVGSRRSPSRERRCSSCSAATPVADGYRRPGKCVVDLLVKSDLDVLPVASAAAVRAPQRPQLPGAGPPLGLTRLLEFEWSRPDIERCSGQGRSRRRIGLVYDGFGGGVPMRHKSDLDVLPVASSDAVRDQHRTQIHVDGHPLGLNLLFEFELSRPDIERCSGQGRSRRRIGLVYDGFGGGVLMRHLDVDHGCFRVDPAQGEGYGRGQFVISIEPRFTSMAIRSGSTCCLNSSCRGQTSNDAPARGAPVDASVLCMTVSVGAF